MNKIKNIKEIKLVTLPMFTLQSLLSFGITEWGGAAKALLQLFNTGQR